MSMTMRYFIFVCCMIFGGSLVSAAPMAGHGQVEEQMFRVVDGNGDGAISLDEFNAFQALQFRKMDTNGDSKITHEEMEAGHGKKTVTGSTHLEDRFMAADGNHDGGLDRGEAKYMPMLSMYFDEVDTNKDGMVALEEYYAAMVLLHRGKSGSSGSKTAL